jgi:chemotaxis protein methyltransferase CheR
MQSESVPDLLLTDVSELIAEKLGLHFPPQRHVDLRRGLTDAAAQFGFPDVGAYAAWLLAAKPSTPQLHSLASHLTIGETYFFRDRRLFDALARHVLPQLIRRRRGREQRLRLWSTACSTGEEPYTLAILLQQLLPDWDDWNVTILGTDINARSLQKAAAGVYGEWSFRDCPPELRQSYFAPAGEGRVAILPHIRRRVSFRQMNLAEDGFPALYSDTNAMDVILCRNVLIYFTPTHVRRLVENLRHALLDGGWLAVSPSECSQALFGRYAAVEFAGAILYRKREAVEQPHDSWAAYRPTAAAPAAVIAPTPAAVVPSVFNRRAAAESESAPRPAAEFAAASTAEPVAAAQALYGAGRYGEAAQLLLLFATSPAPVRPGLSPTGFSLLTRSLANQGRFAEALSWSGRWIAAAKIDASAHYLQALILQELGDTPAAQRSLQRTLYLQPDFALAHFALGNYASDSPRSATAIRHYGNALRLLRSRLPQEQVPESDGLTAARLVEIIKALLPPEECVG